MVAVAELAAAAADGWQLHFPSAQLSLPDAVAAPSNNIASLNFIERKLETNLKETQIVFLGKP